MLAAFQAFTIGPVTSPSGMDGGATAICAARTTIHVSGARVCKLILVAAPVAVCVAGSADPAEPGYVFHSDPERQTWAERHGIPLGSRPPPAAFVAA